MSENVDRYTDGPEDVMDEEDLKELFIEETGSYCHECGHLSDEHDEDGCTRCGCHGYEE